MPARPGSQQELRSRSIMQKSMKLPILFWATQSGDAGHKSSFYGSNNYVNSLNLYIPLRLHVLNSLDRLFVLWKGCNNRISSGKR